MVETKAVESEVYKPPFWPPCHHMFGLISLLLSARRASLLPYLNVTLVFIACMLLLFLCLSCYHSSNTFSQVYTIEARSNGTSTIRAGYFGMCIVKGDVNSTAVPQCAKLGHFKSDDLSYMFAKHVSRPYFVVISTVLSVLSLVGSIVVVYSPKIRLRQTNLTLVTVTLGFTIITACWQQVAVQAAVILIPNEVKKGHRAAGMVWGAVSMLILSVCSIFARNKLSKEEQTDDFDSMHTLDSEELKHHRAHGLRERNA